MARRPLTWRRYAIVFALAVMTAAATGPVLRDTTAAAPVPRLLALVAPRNAASGERYVLYAGLADLSKDAVILTRICHDDGPCILERATHVAEGGAWWGWIGAFEAPAGQYIGHLYVRAPGRGGDRTIATTTWSMRVHD